LHTSIVGHALDEFDKGDGVDPPRNAGTNTFKSSKLLLCGETLVVTEIALLYSSFTLREEEGRRISVVKRGVLALRITRGIDESRVQANGLL
jgi:hypothetical protein